GNLVQGNFIGTNVNGAAPLANGTNGVMIHLGALGNTVGGAAPGAGNVLSGNTLDGVDLEDTGTSGNVIAGNVIGTDVSGNVALPNRVEGVFVGLGASGNTVGGTAPGSGNLISGQSNQGSYGVVLRFAGTANNVVQGNRIGTNAAGTAA